MPFYAVENSALDDFRKADGPRKVELFYHLYGYGDIKVLLIPGTILVLFELQLVPDWLSRIGFWGFVSIRIVGGEYLGCGFGRCGGEL